MNQGLDKEVVQRSKIIRGRSSSARLRTDNRVKLEKAERFIISRGR